MSRKIIFGSALLSLFVSVALFANTLFDADVVEKIKITQGDVPAGFVYGKIPAFAKDVLKDNPWSMDQGAINKLTKNIYPDGNYRSVKSMHVAILARKDAPYSDDIVCYIVVYKNKSGADIEIKKLNEYAKFNSDRVVVFSKKNVAVFLHVDDVDDFNYLYDLKKTIEGKLQTL